MNYLPLYHRMTDQACLVVGGGKIAQRKVALLLSAGAQITLVAPKISESLQDRLNSQTALLRKFEVADLEGKHLVVCATDDESLNKYVAELATAKQIPCNVVDNTALSTVIFPAIVDRSPVILTVSSSGQSPVVTRLLRSQLEALIPESIGRLTSFLGRYRDRLKQHWPDPDKRRKVTESFLSSGRFDQSLAIGSTQQVDNRVAETEAWQFFVDAADSEDTDELFRGEVYLVGAGPGDPDLLTLKALQLMQQADVVFYDNLVSDLILNRLRRDADRHYVGKEGRGEFTPQENINELLVKYAKLGHRVLRLKGGDPFIFGRGGEELQSLIDEKIPFQVVPGITAASGCAAYAGIPLTHRDYSQSVRFVTGHPKQGQVELAWSEFAHAHQTVVFYMGLGGLKSICEQLILHGRSPTTPIAVISKGTTIDQQTLVSDLENIEAAVAEHKPQRPTLIIVGEVVSYRQQLFN